MRDVTTYDRLYYICSVEAIHAISSEDSSLLLVNLEILRIAQFGPAVKSKAKINLEVAVTGQLILENIDELRQVLPLHFLAFSMEVKPSVA